jgi:arylformamidase
MVAMNLVAEYDNRALVPDHPRIILDWYANAKAYRESARCELDISYGARVRNKCDLFYPAHEKGGAIIVFIHGGYWRSFDKSVFSHMAAGANAHGFTVAIPSYTLCPEATIPEIVAELRQCCLFLGNRFGLPLVVAGHSAGGHLAACMAATGWSLLGARTGLVRSGMSVSGIFDLRPLMVTPCNDDLRLNPVDAMTASPLFWPVPQKLAFDSWVGEQESFEFLRQARSLAAAWTGLGMISNYVVVPGENHFTVPAALANPQSPMVRRLVELAD